MVWKFIKPFIMSFNRWWKYIWSYNTLIFTIWTLTPFLYFALRLKISRVRYRSQNIHQWRIQYLSEDISLIFLILILKESNLFYHDVWKFLKIELFSLPKWTYFSPWLRSVLLYFARYKITRFLGQFLVHEAWSYHPH